MTPALLLMLSVATQSNVWTEAHRSAGLVVFTRHHDGAHVNEMRAIGEVDAPADVLWSLVKDVEGHTRLIPDTTVSKIVRQDGDDTIVLQRCESHVLDPREYVIAVREQDETLPDGRVRHTLSWHAAPRYAALVHTDAVRVDVNEGFWSVEPLPGGRARITFQVLLDPAGFVPAALVNLSQTVGAEQALAVLTSAAHRAAAPQG